MLCQLMNRKQLEAKLIPYADWKPFPPACDRTAWDGLLAKDINRQRAAYLKGAAELLLNKPWPLLTAVGYSDFIEDGNRTRYEAVYFERRNNLALLILAECFEHEGQYLKEIVTGLVHLLEESTWALPAHVHRIETDPFQRDDQECVDLFACETAAVLAEGLFLLEAELTAYSPTLVRRIRREIDRRIVTPVETEMERLWWRQGVNNWTPWCAMNALCAALHVVQDPERLSRIIADVLNPVVDRFYDRYPDDGCCDEGARYWNASPAALFGYLEHIQSRTADAFPFYQDEKLKRMGEFIANAHLSGVWSVNFADSSANAAKESKPEYIYHYGRKIGSAAMQDLALHLIRDFQPDGRIRKLFHRRCCGGDLQVMLRDLFWLDAEAPLRPLTKHKTVWYPHTQVLIARETEFADRGFALAAKGGHNGENHNHNDIGQFIVMKDGTPLIVDAGVADYSRVTFSPQRYTLWYMRTEGHNAPVIHDVEQAAGENFRATDVSAVTEGEVRSLSMELSTAYPEQAGVRSYRRTFSLKPDEIVMEDSVVCERETSVSIRLLTPRYAETSGNTAILENEGKRVRLELTGGEFSPIETIRIDDRVMCRNWGDSLTSLWIRAAIPAGGATLRLTIKPY